MPSYSGKRKNKPTLPCVRTSEPILSGEDSDKLKDGDDVSLREPVSQNFMEKFNKRMSGSIAKWKKKVEKGDSVYCGPTV